MDNLSMPNMPRNTERPSAVSKLLASLVSTYWQGRLRQKMVALARYHPSPHAMAPVSLLATAVCTCTFSVTASSQ